jgi:hypothetical protein
LNVFWALIALIALMTSRSRLPLTWNVPSASCSHAQLKILSRSIAPSLFGRDGARYKERCYFFCQQNFELTLHNDPSHLPREHRFLEA